jgi:hypothetical protein
MPSRIVAQVWGAAPAAICCFFDLAGVTSSCPVADLRELPDRKCASGPKVPPRLASRKNIKLQKVINVTAIGLMGCY